MAKPGDSRRKGAPAYARRQDRLAKRAAPKKAKPAPTPYTPGSAAVPAALTPEQQAEKNNADFNIADSLIEAEQNWRDVAGGEKGSPEYAANEAKAAARINEAYNRGVGDLSENLAGRGLIGQGLQASQLYDVTRLRDLASVEHAATVTRATERYTAIKRSLDLRKGAADIDFARLAGANIKAAVPATGKPPSAPTNTPAKSANPQAAQDLSQRRIGDTSYSGALTPGGRNIVYKGKDWAKVAQLFPKSQFQVKPMPKPKAKK